jgi:uncharacterized protein (DUF58 family)
VTGIAPAAFLDPALLAGISDLSLLARTVVDGFLHGLHRSVRTGTSVDFAEHRPYQPGDDLRRIDWRVYGRTDRFYLKTYEADTNADVLFVLDSSGSMDFTSGGLTKFDYARYLTAALAWLAQRQGDRVGLVTVRDEMVDVVPPSTRHLNLLLHTVAASVAKGEGKLPRVLEKVTQLRGRSGMVVLLSDCYEDPLAFSRAVGGLRTRGHDVMVFHLADAAERDLPYDAPGTFEDAETGMRLPLKPEEVRERYRTMVDEHRRALASGLAGAGVDYQPIATEAPLDGALRAYLDRRLMATKSR